MKNLIIAVLMVGILARVIALDEEPKELVQARAAYQAQLNFSAQAYLQKLETLKKTPARPKSQVDAMQAEISRFKKQIADGEAATLPNTAPVKPEAKISDIKVGKITEFPKDLTAMEWDKLPGKVVKVNAAEESNYGKDAINIKNGEYFYAVPHPTDRWNLNKKVSCTWEGIPNENPGFSGSFAGKMMMYASKTEGKQQNSSWNNMELKNMIEGPLKVCFNSGYSYEQYPKIYYKGEIRVKLVPAE